MTQKQDLLKNERTNTEQSHYKKISLFAMVKFFDKAQKVVPKNVLQKKLTNAISKNFIEKAILLIRSLLKLIINCKSRCKYLIFLVENITSYEEVGQPNTFVTNLGHF